MCHRMATRVIRCSLVRGEDPRPLCHSRAGAAVLHGAGRPDLRADDAADPAQCRGADRQGRRWTVVVRVLYTLLAAGARRHDSDGAAVGILFGLGRLSADREFVALQACGVSVFRVLPSDCPARRRRLRRHRLRDDRTRCPTRTRRSARSRSTSSPRAPRATSSRACSSRNFPNRVLYVRDIQPPGRLARRVSRRRHAAGADDGVSWPRRDAW